MNRPIAVISPHGDHEENVERIVKILGSSKLRLHIFNFLYGRVRQPKTVTQILVGLGLSADKRQSVLNELTKLRGIISKEVVTKSAGVGSEYAYCKIDSIMAIKPDILRNYAKPELLRRTPTKRRPAVHVTVKSPPISKTRIGRRTKLRLLYLTAAPNSQKGLRTEAEVRAVKDALRGAIHREEVELHVNPAADAKTILQGINDHRPQIVHFSGHGGKKAIWLDDGKMKNSVGQPMSFDDLAQTLAATSTPPTLLVLNACDTLSGAGVLLDAVEAVVGMSDSISDEGAGIFASQFYAAIASAQPVSAALAQGKIAMKAGMADADLPTLIHRKGVEPDSLVLVRGRAR